MPWMAAALAAAATAGGCLGAGVAAAADPVGNAPASTTPATPPPLPVHHWKHVEPTTLPTVWGCFPGMANNPCEGSQRTTVLQNTQLQPRKVARVEEPAAAADPPVDCFYLYPTVTSALGNNAPRRVDADVRGVLQAQAARFSSVCRVYAPVWRQATLTNLLGNIAVKAHGPTNAQNVAYSDVLGAWHDYLAHDNDGRGVILVGHSQGAATLARLMIHEFDDVPENRARLVGAILPGSDFYTARGFRTGGNLANIPTCAAAGEAGCVVAYSSYSARPGGASYFGRLGALSDSFGGDRGSQFQVACTNPAALSGDDGALEPVARGVLQPGVNGLASLAFWGGVPPVVSTPWVIPGDHYTGACEAWNGANVLRVRAGRGSLLPAAVPSPDWGLHVGEMSLTLGNLVKIARLQAATYLAARGGAATS
jgi:hypothetical protein